MEIKIIYGYCFPESTTYQTIDGEIDGWTFSHIIIPKVFDNFDYKGLTKGLYHFHLEKGSGGVYISLKTIETVKECIMPIPVNELKKVENDKEYFKFMKETKLTNWEKCVPRFWVIATA